MRRLKSNQILIGILLISITFGSYGFSCSSKDPKVRQLAKVSDDVSQGLLSTAEIVRDSKANGTLTQDDVDLLRPLLKQIGETNGQAIAIGKSLNNLDDIPTDKQAQLLQLISFASDTIVQLNNEGVLRIKDPQKRLIFNSLVLAMQASITSIVPLLKLGGAK